LMISQRPELTPAQVGSALQASARPFPASGADNGPDDPTPVVQCHAPAVGVEQLQCYCSSGLCGAGMVDAGAAVAAVAGALAQIDVSGAAPTAGQLVTLSGTASLASPGATVTGFDWTLLDGGGIVSAFASATNAATATLQPTAAGSFTVRLTVTDSLGHTANVERNITVAAPEVTSSDSGGGGGLVSAPWVAGLVLAAFALRRTKRRRAQRASQGR